MSELTRETTIIGEPEVVEDVQNSASWLSLKEAVTSTGHELIRRDHPFKWGEDFGLFTAKYKGCMFGLGSGEEMPALHNPDYDFPDELIPHGVELFETAVRSFLKG